MRLIGAASIVFILAVAFAVSGFVPATQAEQTAAASERERAARHKDGQAIFRFDTFGDEQLWTDVLRMHEVIPTVDPATALAVGLKVDVEALPGKVIAALRAGQVDLTDPAVTVELLRLNAVVGVKGTVDDAGRLTKVGVTCALCHSSVDDSFAPGIGKRLDGWANTDLNVGAIVALSPALDDATKAEFRSWGARKVRPTSSRVRRHQHHSAEQSVAADRDPADLRAEGCGLRDVHRRRPHFVLEQLRGRRPDGRPRQLQRSTNRIVHQADAGSRHAEAGRAAGLPIEPAQPEAVRAAVSIAGPPSAERICSGSQARCSTCHQSPNFTDVLSGPDRTVPFLHDPAEVGMDPAYAARSATGKYRTTPLRGLLQHPPYFHDGSAPDLIAVVNHYDTLFGLNLTAAQKADLVEYLKSL